MCFSLYKHKLSLILRCCELKYATFFPGDKRNIIVIVNGNLNGNEHPDFKS